MSRPSAAPALARARALATPRHRRVDRVDRASRARAGTCSRAFGDDARARSGRARRWSDGERGGPSPAVARALGVDERGGEEARRDGTRAGGERVGRAAATASGRGRGRERIVARAKGGQFAPPGDVVPNSVAVLEEELQGELQAAADAAEADEDVSRMVERVVERVDDDVLAQQSAAIAATFVDDFVPIATCDLDDPACERENAKKRVAAFAQWERMVNASSGLSKRTRGLLLFGTSMAGFGANITLLKDAQEHMSSDLFSLLRFGVAALAFSPFLKNALQDSRITRGGLELGAWCALGYALQNIGIENTDAARASFISSFTIIAVPMIAGVAGRTVRNQTWVATAIALIGLAFMESLVPIPGFVDSAVEITDIVSEGAPDSLIGDLFTLGSAFVFGIHIFRTDCIFNGISLTHKQSMGLVCLQMLTVCSVFVGVLGSDLIANAGDLASVTHVSSFTEIPWAEVALVGILTTAGCIYLETVALTLLASQEATLMYSTEPVWGALFAYLILGETLTKSASFGAAMILLSTVVGSAGAGGGDDGSATKTEASTVSS